ncbi:fha domain-containing [Cystoisospora suis]|uniref:Fha domain-containing n=1 Tax=Cystoisospora suis TaxID=483139 RepID=A0A2C6KPB0_9APIC|nr:fha domain-containing [Cystoisospora suis]
MDRQQHLQPRSGAGSSSNSRSSSRSRGCVMSISCLTWASDSHGLFDYESRNVFKKNFKIQCLRESYRAIRIKADVVLLPEDEAVQFLQQQQHLSASDVRSLLKLQWTNGAYHVIPSHASEVCVEPPASSTASRPSHNRTNASGSACPQRAPQSSPARPALSSSSSPAMRGSTVMPECVPGVRGRSPSDANAVLPLPRGELERQANCRAAVEVEQCNLASSSSPRAGNDGVTCQLSPPFPGGSEDHHGHQPRLECEDDVPGANEAQQQLSDETPRGGVDAGEVAGGVGGTVAALFGARSTAAFLDGVEGEAEAEPEEDRADSIRARSRLHPHLVGSGRASGGIDEEDEGDENNSGFFLHSGVSLPAGFAGGGTGGPGGGGLAGAEGRGYSEKIWLVVRSMRERGGVKLREGDVMKLGRFRLKVKELVANYQQAALAQERRLPAADTDECETVAPEPESHNNATTHQASSAATSHHHHHFPGSLGSLVPAVGGHHQHRTPSALSSSIPLPGGTHIGLSSIGAEVGGSSAGGDGSLANSAVHAGGSSVCAGADSGRNQQPGQTARAIDVDDAAASGSQGEGSVRTSARDGSTQRPGAPIRAFSGSASALSRLSGPAASRVSSRSGAGFSDSGVVCGTEGECGGRGSTSNSSPTFRGPQQQLRVPLRPSAVMSHLSMRSDGRRRSRTAQQPSRRPVQMQGYGQQHLLIDV